MKSLRMCLLDTIHECDKRGTDGRTDRQTPRHRPRCVDVVPADTMMLLRHQLTSHTRRQSGERKHQECSHSRLKVQHLFCYFVSYSDTLGKIPLETRRYGLSKAHR